MIGARRTPTYTIRRSVVSRRRAAAMWRAPAPPRVNNQGMLSIFNRPASLPIATMRSASRTETFVSRVRGARSTGWCWVRPRLVPATVAIIGMLAVLGSAEYLTQLARYTPEQAVAISEPQIASLPAPPPIEDGLSIATSEWLLLDGKPTPIGRVLQLPSSGAPVQIRLVPHR